MIHEIWFSYVFAEARDSFESPFLQAVLPYKLVGWRWYSVQSPARERDSAEADVEITRSFQESLQDVIGLNNTTNQVWVTEQQES